MEGKNEGEGYRSDVRLPKGADAPFLCRALPIIHQKNPAVVSLFIFFSFVSFFSQHSLV